MSHIQINVNCVIQIPQKVQTAAKKIFFNIYFPAGGQNSCFFQNNSPTVADINTKFSVPYPTSIWYLMIKFDWNRSEIFREIDVFVGSLRANFSQNRLNVSAQNRLQFRLAKNKFSKKPAQTDQYKCNMTRSTKWQSWNFQTLSFWTPKFRNPIFLGKKLFKIPFLFEKTGISVIEPHVYSLYASF